MDEPSTSLRGDVRRYGRRTFLLTTAAGFSSLLWGRPLWRAASPLVTSVLDVVAPGLVPGWRIYTVSSRMPSFDPARWRLRVDGLVERPVELAYSDVLSLARVNQITDFHCVTGWSVENVRWAGVRLSTLLALARPTADAHAVTFVSGERPYADSLTLEQAALPDVLLAYELDGRPLPREHGAPLRLVMPRMYGYKSVKWVERITLTAQPEVGYWEQRGYDLDAWVGRSNA